MSKKNNPQIKITKSTRVCIKQNGQTFYGFADCHPDDMDLYSDLIGGSLAHLRAQIDAANYTMRKSYQNWQAIRKAYLDICQTPKYTVEQLDPTGRFTYSVKRAEKQYRKDKETYHQLKQDLHEYIQNQEKVFKRLREAKATRQGNFDKAN